MTPKEVAYLGPAGTYSHLVAEKHYGHRCPLTPVPTILDVFLFVHRRPDRHGIVPIENSSGGAIYETVDMLIENKPRVFIERELSLQVTLALIGRHGERIRTLYSHFAPLEHCVGWLKKHLPKVDRQVCNSTAVAARMAFVESNAAALGHRKLARLYNLDVLRYPVEADIPNLTSFLVISGRGDRRLCRTGKTTLAARTPNKPGSLCDFLETFRDENVNLCRLISRPVRGCPREYAFLVDIEGGADLPSVERALKAARKTCTHLRVVGSYPCRRPFTS